MNKRKGNVSNFHGMGGPKGSDGLFMGAKWLFFTTLGRILSTVMSCPFFSQFCPRTPLPLSQPSLKHKF